MNGRYVVFSAASLQPAIRVDSLEDARRYQRILRGEIVDRRPATAKAAA